MAEIVQDVTGHDYLNPRTTFGEQLNAISARAPGTNTPMVIASALLGKISVYGSP